MPEKELSAIPGWTLEYPDDYIAREEVKITAVSDKAQLTDLKLVEDIYELPIDFDIGAFTNPVPGKERSVVIKGLKGRPLEILLADFSFESWAIICSARENIKKVTTEEERLIHECVIAWSQKRWVNITSLLTARLWQYQEVLIFGGYLKSDERATRKLDEATLAAHRAFMKEGLNKRLKLDDKKVREIQRIVQAKETGRYGLETVLKVVNYQKILKENAGYTGRIDGFWNEEAERLRSRISERGKPEKPIAKNETEKEVKITFDGSLLTADGRTFHAVSGIPQVMTHRGADNFLEILLRFDYSLARPQSKDEGPIPEGVYWIDVDELKEGGIRHTFYPSSWGKSSITLHPDETTNTWGRGGFFIHGGTQPGSKGCIDLGGGGPLRLEDDMPAFTNFIKQFKGCVIEVRVKYSKQVVEHRARAQVRLFQQRLSPLPRGPWAPWLRPERR